MILWTAPSLLASLKVEPIAQASNFIRVCKDFGQDRVIRVLQDCLQTWETNGRCMQSHFGEKEKSHFDYGQSCVYSYRLAYKYLVMLECVRVKKWLQAFNTLLILGYTGVISHKKYFKDLWLTQQCSWWLNYHAMLVVLLLHMGNLFVFTHLKQQASWDSSHCRCMQPKQTSMWIAARNLQCFGRKPSLLTLRDLQRQSKPSWWSCSHRRRFTWAMQKQNLSSRNF